jgi:hypothetical protein
LRAQPLTSLVLVLAGLAAIYALAVVALALGQRKLMYFPNAQEIAPAAAGLPQARVLEVTTEDGERLVAWRLRLGLGVRRSSIFTATAAASTCGLGASR